MKVISLALRLAASAASAASVLIMIYADHPRLMMATRRQTSAEIILEAAAWSLPNQRPDQVIHATEGITLEFNPATEKKSGRVIFLKAKAADPLADPLADARVVVWSHHPDISSGCLELFPSVAGFERGEILAGICQPLPEAEHIFAMDYLAMTNALNFVANSYISLTRDKLLSQGKEYGDELTIAGIRRLEAARVQIVKLAAAHSLWLREDAAIVLMMCCLVMLYELVSLYLETKEVAENRIEQTVRSFFSGEVKGEIRVRLLRERNEKMWRASEQQRLIDQARQLDIAESVQSALAAGDPDRARQIIALAEEKLEAQKRAKQAAKEAEQARVLFLAQAHDSPPDVRRQVEELYDRGNRDRAKELIEHEEEKLFRRKQLDDLTKRMNECLDPVAKDAAGELLNVARAELDGKRHEWHKQIYRIETLLKYGNGTRRPSRPH